MRKQIAGFKFRNGVFGVNHGSICRVSDGYTVNSGGGQDSAFYETAHKAKVAYRSVIAQRMQEREFEQYRGAHSAY